MNAVDKAIVAESVATLQRIVEQQTERLLAQEAELETLRARLTEANQVAASYIRAAEALRARLTRLGNAVGAITLLYPGAFARARSGKQRFVSLTTERAYLVELEAAGADAAREGK